MRSVSPRIADRTAAFALLAALTGGAAALLPVGPPVVRLALLLGTGLFAPGYVLARHLPGTARMEEPLRVAFAFPFSAALFGAIGFIAQLAGFGNDPVRAAFVPLLVLSAAVLLPSVSRRKDPKHAFPPAVALVTLILLPIGLARGGEITLRDDSLDHIAYLREIQETGANFPVTSYFDPSTDEGYDIRKGYLQPVFAAAASLTSADAFDIWNVLPGLAMAFFSVAFFALASESTTTPRRASIAWIGALLLFDHGFAGNWFARAGTPFLFAGPLIWCALLLVLRSSHTGRSAPAAALVLGFALMACHLFAAVTAAVLGSLFIGLLLIARRRRARWGGPLATMAFLCAGFLPVGIWRAITSYPPVDPIHTHLQDVVFVGKGLYMCDPFLAAGRTALAGLAAIPLSALLLPGATRSNRKLFLLAITLVPIFILFNPLVVPLVVPVLGYLVTRIAWFGGNYIVLGELAGAWWTSVHSGRGRVRRAAAAGALLGMAVLSATSLYAGDRQDRWKSLTFHRTPGSGAIEPAGWTDLFDQVRRSVPPRATIASDPVTGYLLPAFTGRKSVAILAQHSSPADRRAPARLKDAVRLMSPYIDSAETARILERYGAKYVVLNFRFPGAITLDYGAVDPKLYAATLEKFRREPDRYVEMYHHDKVHLFRVTDHPPSDSPPVLKGTVASIPAGAGPVGELFPDGVRLVAASVSPLDGGVHGGIRIESYWRKEHETSDPLPYRLYVRLDREGERPGDGPFGKIARKLAQAAQGKLYRCRTSTNLMRGAYPPFAWTVGETVADRFDYYFPGKLAPGRYRVEMLLRRKTHMQTYDIGDFFSERDSFSGVAVGYVMVGGDDA